MKVFDGVRDYVKDQAIFKMRTNHYKIFLDIDKEDSFDDQNHQNSDHQTNDLI